MSILATATSVPGAAHASGATMRSRDYHTIKMEHAAAKPVNSAFIEPARARPPPAALQRRADGRRSAALPKDSTNVLAEPLIGGSTLQIGLALPPDVGAARTDT